MSRHNFHTIRRNAHVAGKLRAATSAIDSLRTHQTMAALMPAVMRIAAIQKDCAAVLPALFDKCAVQRFESGQLVLSAPNAALATRLKQQLPKLQEALSQAGWQVSAIRTKVQVPENTVKIAKRVKPPVPRQGIEALSALVAALEKSSNNEALKTALAKMIAHHG